LRRNGVGILQTKDGKLWYKDKELGPSSALYLDSHEATKLTGSDGVIHAILPERVDGIMVDSGGDVVVIESKRPSDLASSQKDRRLARQMKIAIALGDKVILLLRPSWALYNLDGKPNLPMFMDIAKLQKLGVFVLPGPINDIELPEWLYYYKKVLGETVANSVKAIIGDDAVVSSDPWYLVLALKGMGKVQLAKIKKQFKSPWDFFVESDDSLKHAGVRSNVIDERKKALNGLQ
jgi:hypothetical protein